MMYLVEYIKPDVGIITSGFLGMKNKPTTKVQAFLIKSDRDTPLTFGKHKGRTLTQINKTHPHYIIWLAEKEFLI